ncbi:MAG: SusC/RagA family protein, partial [Tannerellaceae bacterium]|nr:SusC/RagA family protein [Tannerellaceae bacterium]
TPTSNPEFIIGHYADNHLERYTIKGDLTQQANKWLTIGLNMQGTRSSNNGVLNGPNNLSGASYASIRMLPNVPVYSDEHESGYNIKDKALGGGSNLKNIDDNTPNIVWVLDNYVDRLQNTRVIGGGWAEIKFMDGLTLKTQGGMDLGSSDEYVYRPPEHGDGESAGGYIYDYRITNRNWN